MIRVPFQLIKRLSDGPGGEMKYQIEIPVEYVTRAHKFELYKSMFFIALGPAEDVEEIERLLKAGQDEPM